MFYDQKKELVTAGVVHTIRRSSVATFQSVPIPIKTGVVVRVSLRPEKVTEHAAKVGNIWLGLKLETTAISEVFGKLTGASLTEGRDSNTLLLFHDELVLFGGRLGLESLPREPSLEEVNQDVANRLQIISSGLFDT